MTKVIKLYIGIAIENLQNTSIQSINSPTRVCINKNPLPRLILISQLQKEKTNLKTALAMVDLILHFPWNHFAHCSWYLLLACVNSCHVLSDCFRVTLLIRTQARHTSWYNIDLRVNVLTWCRVKLEDLFDFFGLCWEIFHYNQTVCCTIQTTGLSLQTTGLSLHFVLVLGCFRWLLKCINAHIRRSLPGQNWPRIDPDSGYRSGFGVFMTQNMCQIDQDMGQHRNSVIDPILTGF